MNGPRPAPPDAVTAEKELRVSTLELFFDLVFVFTLTQLTALLADDLSPATAGRVLLIFVVLFWMYGGYAYLTNQVPPDRTSRRLPLICGMGAFLICALALPHAFDDGGIAFGLSYLLVVVVHGALYSRSHGALVLWFTLPNVITALCVTAAGLLDGLAADGLWVLAILLQFGTPFLLRLSHRTATSTGRVRLDARLNIGHFVERHGLLLLVAFGESVIAIGIGLGELPLSIGPAGGALLALALATALWWTYFSHDAEVAEAVLTDVSPERRFRLAQFAYFYSYIPMLLGVVVLAAGTKKSVGHLAEHLHAGPATALAGGVALFLVGSVAFRTALRISPIGPRVAATVLALVTVPIGMYVATVAQLVALVLLLIGLLTIEAKPQSTLTSE